MGAAGGREVCPQAALLATALLADGQGANRVDQRVIQGVRSWWSPVMVTRLGPAANDELWVIDQSNSRVHLPGDRVVDLRRNALFLRFLVVMFMAGGERSIEQLATEVWDVDDYHPLRDDRRIRVAVRRLRGLLEDDASAPRRLITTDGGYALSASLPCVLVSGRAAARS